MKEKHFATIFSLRNLTNSINLTYYIEPEALKVILKKGNIKC